MDINQMNIYLINSLQGQTHVCQFQFTQKTQHN